MPTNQKTSRLGLCNWSETDKPMRTDFTGDNQIIDEKLGEHLADAALHLSGAERLLLEHPADVSEYFGNGQESQSKELSFTPRMVLVFAMNKPLSEITGGAVKCNAAAATYLTPGGGISVQGQTVYVTQTQGAAQNGVFYSLNAKNTVYALVAFR